MRRVLRVLAPVMAGLVAGLLVLAAGVWVVIAAPELGIVLPWELPADAPSASATPGPSQPTPSPAHPSASESPTGPPEVGLRVGQLAPPLEVDQAGGGQINLTALRGKAVWLTFVASWCPPCYDEMPLMEGYWLRLQDQGIAIVGVDVNERRRDAEALVKQTRVTFPVGLDPTAVTQPFWGRYRMPVHFWLDRDGIIRAFAFGGIRPDQMEAGIRSVLPEVDLSTPAPTPIGELQPTPGGSP